MTATAAQKAFRLDTNLCTGCGACAVACAIENELEWGTSWRFIETFNPQHVPGLPHYHLSLACNHCADAPCMHSCPALAYHKDDLTGAVLLNQDQCIGCKYCTWACPYDAPRFDAKAGVVSKCTFCHHRQMEGLTPACVGQCPTGALTFGDLAALDGQAGVAGFPDTPARPSVRFEPLRGDARGPGPASEVPRALAAPVRPRGKTSLASEGSLVVFTLLAALLTGLMASPQGRGQLSLPSFLVMVAMAGGASTLHLGRKARAWRAVLNVRRSWLSREVALFSLFAALGAVSLSPVSPGPWVSAAAAWTGFALLFAVDRVYGVTRMPGLAVHSAGILLTGVMVAGLAVGVPWVWGSAAVAKIWSHGWRTLGRKRGNGLLWGGIRWGPGLVLPVAVLLAGQAVTLSPSVVAVCLVLLGLGEVVDRCSFYLELEVTTPRGELVRELERRVAA